MRDREKIIEEYFQAWINNNSLIIDEIFDVNIVYSECYGPEYRGRDIVKKWFEDWHDHGKVIAWDIKRFIHEKNLIVVEWYFKCGYDKKIGEFDGVSIIEFNDKNLIETLKEFQSKIPHYFPYN